MKGLKKGRLKHLTWGRAKFTLTKIAFIAFIAILAGLVVGSFYAILSIISCHF